MHFFASLVTLGLAGIAYTAPVDLDKRALTTDWIVATVTVTTTISAQATPAVVGGHALVQQAGDQRPHTRNRKTKTVEPVTEPTPTPSPAAEESSTTTIEQTPSPSDSTSSPPSSQPGKCPSSWPKEQPDFSSPPDSCGISWLDIINKWRAVYNKNALTWDSRLAKVAYDAGVANRGGAMKPAGTPFQHTNLGTANSQGETMTPGYFAPPEDANMHGVSPFEAAVLNWLCESPSDKLVVEGVNLCKAIVDDVDHITLSGTGHFDIFTSKDFEYKSIGCAFVPNFDNPTGLFAGAYVCDYGM